MADVDVTKTRDDEDGFAFSVTVREAGTTSRHDVTLSREDFDATGDRFSSPDEFVRRCFDFLLEREPKESILARFDVREIARYFPEFQRTIIEPRSP